MGSNIKITIFYLRKCIKIPYLLYALWRKAHLSPYHLNVKDRPPDVKIGL